MSISTVNAAKQEMASRILSRRRLLPFVERLNPKYMSGWVHEDICRRLERFSDDVEAGLSPRLMLLMPPRAGKSELASKMFPAWHLGRHPDHDIIACSYNVALAMGFSKKIKAILEDPSYQTVFETRLDPNNQSSEEWGVHQNSGGYVAAGVGGGITGKGCRILVIDDPCVAEGQRIRTGRGLTPIEDVKVGDLVLTHMGRWRKVTARFDNGVKEVVELSTNTLKVIVTPEHKVYTSEGWVEAQNAKDVYSEKQHAAWRHGGQSSMPVHLLPHPVAQVRQFGLARVFDLTVEEDHSFVAEGIVVHNCKNAEEADSATTREAIWDWYGSTAYTRLAPGGGVLVVQTWWHDDDLAGRLQQAMANASPEDLDTDRFDVVKYPAIAEYDEYLDPETDAIVRLTPGETPAPEVKFLRAKGDALHPERYDVQKLRKIKATIAPRFWSALYQQNPVPDDGAFFTKDMFRRGPLPDRKSAVVQIAWDFAISEKTHNDYTVGTVGLLDFDDVLHVAEVVRFKSGDAEFIINSILNLAQRWYHPSLRLGFEDGQIYRSIATLLKKEMRARKFYPSIEVLKPITDKKARASPLQGRMQQGMVSFADTNAEWYDTARNEMLRFPAGVHDDVVDSISWMATLALGREPPHKPAEKKEKSWRDKLNFSARGGHMAA